MGPTLMLKTLQSLLTPAKCVPFVGMSPLHSGSAAAKLRLKTLQRSFFPINLVSFLGLGWAGDMALVAGWPTPAAGTPTCPRRPCNSLMKQSVNDRSPLKESLMATVEDTGGTAGLQTSAPVQTDPVLKQAMAMANKRTLATTPAPPPKPQPRL